MRLFTAIDLPADVRDRLDRLIGELRPLARINWSPSSNLHITIKFIGEWPEERLSHLQRGLASVGSRPPIAIRVGGLQFFPNSRSPRVFCAGVEASRELAALAADTNQTLAKLDIEPDTRAYSPHLTLGRIKAPKGLAPLHEKVQESDDPEFGSFLADRFFLYRSKPGASGSVYTKLSEFPIVAIQ